MAQENCNEENTNKESPRGKKIIRILLGVICAALIALAVLGMRLLNSINRPGEALIFEAAEDDILITPVPIPSSDITPAPSATPAPTPIPMSELYEQTWLDDVTKTSMEANRTDDRYIHVLLIGVDRRTSSGNSNTDTMMIATIDTVHGSLKLTTLMRDMLINIPGEGYGKLNSAAVRGGTELLFDTINSNFCLDLKEYVLVDFSMFEKIVDEIGGVTVKMTAEEISAANDCIAGLNKQRGIEDTWDGFIFAEAGNVKLNGKQALGYARVRKIDSDFTRTERQYKLLNSIYAKFRALDTAKQYELIQDILPLVETNMTNQRIIDCATKILGMDIGGILHCRIPADYTYKSTKYERKSVVLADIPANAAKLHEFIFHSSEKAEDAALLKPGASLPPRTPTIYQGADGNYYYYSNNMPAYAMTPAPTE